MGFDALLLGALSWGTLALAVWAFVDALFRPAAAYAAAGKLTKPAWAGITAVAGLLLYWQSPLSLLGLAAVVGSVVYLVDVRPALRGLRRGNNSW